MCQRVDQQNLPFAVVSVRSAWLVERNNGIKERMMTIDINTRGKPIMIGIHALQKNQHKLRRNEIFVDDIKSIMK